MSESLAPSTGQVLQARLAAVNAQIAEACRACGRAPSEIRLLPVSKTHPPQILRQAFAVGMHGFGENKVQEAREKAEALADLDIRWSIIGHLQSNKAKYVARFAHEFQALDSIALASELDRRLQIEGRSLDVLVQINTSGEPQKFGMPPELAQDFLRQMPVFSSLRVKGLMTLAVFDADESRVRACFKRLRQLRDQLRQSAPASIALDELSMGMSGDFPIAIQEGATTVRVGQAIFGARPTSDSHYWPPSDRQD